MKAAKAFIYSITYQGLMGRETKAFRTRAEFDECYRQNARYVTSYKLPAGEPSPK